MSSLRFVGARWRPILAVVSLVAAGVAGAGVVRLCWAEVTPPSAVERRVTQMVTSLMAKQHLSRHPLNDEISQRAFKLFFESLDPLKSYFYQADIDEFQQNAAKLDDMLAENNTSFANVVFQRFLQRVDERVALVDELLQQPVDLTRDEEMITDADQLQYPRDPAEARERWRQRITYDLLLLKAGAAKEVESGEKDAATREREAREKISQRYHNFARRMKQFDNNELLELYLTAITSSYDPHTSYMSPVSLDNFRIALQLKLEGIGAQLQDQDGKTIVAKIVPGGAADKHGKLKKDDQIISVGQGDADEMVDVVGMKINDVVQLIRGDAGTDVRLGVIPCGTNEPVTYTITRAKIELEDQAAHGEVFEVGSKPDGSPLKIGVLDLPSFYQDMQAVQDGARNFRSATTDVRRILGEFKTQGVDAVVLDLRRNGGGSLVEAVDLTGLFIDEGPVVQVMGFDKLREVHRDEDRGAAWDGPLVVVISKFSASASEILAGAVQDYQRGLVVGDEATHGKGTVQSLRYLGELLGVPYPPNYGALKITVQQFFRPNGDSTQKRGVLSDIVLPSITNYMDIGESDLDYAIDFQRIPGTDFAPLNLATAEMIKRLRSASEQRVGQSEEFARLLARIDKYRERKARKSVTLNEAKFLEEGKETELDKEEQAQLEEELEGDNKIKRDFYLDEVLQIARDYVQALQADQLAKVN
ncbi:MAG: carboxy terminal-processing peptidase [Pirellulaceae bacterium]|jgi:carboxyl-terminal processing protease|nr:carboxy terminal-processing peptidase [Pirellulaceae bacterium]